MPAPAAHTFSVDRTRDDTALSALVREALAVPWTQAKRLCQRGKVRVDGELVTDPGHRVREGSIVAVVPSAPVVAAPAPGSGGAAPTHLDRARLVHIDPHVVVFDKPPGINSVPYEEGERGALTDRLVVALHKWNLAPANGPLFVVHRLDRETSGLLVFGRTWVAQRHLAHLFRKHMAERAYVALVHGTFTGERTFESMFVEDRGDGLRGSGKGKAANSGRRAVTHVKSLAVLPHEGGATLVECKLETGRQHQIRIHLSEAGHPIIGERVYIRGYDAPLIDAPRVMLHARTLGFTHPTRPDDEPVRFESKTPDDFVAVARRLGWQG